MVPSFSGCFRECRSTLIYLFFVQYRNVEGKGGWPEFGWLFLRGFCRLLTTPTNRSSGRDRRIRNRRRRGRNRDASLDPPSLSPGFLFGRVFFVLLWLPSFRGFSFGLVLLGLTASTRSFIVFGHPFFILAFLIGWFIKRIVSFVKLSSAPI